MKEMLLDLLLAVIAAAVPVLTAYAVGYIKQAGKHAQANTDNIKAQGYIKEITDAIADAVAATSQTYVDALKQAGKFTPEAQAEAAKKALNACLASISPAAIEFIEGIYGDVKDYLTNKIEAEVRKQKNEAPATLALPVLESTSDPEAIADTVASKISDALVQAIQADSATGAY